MMTLSVPVRLKNIQIKLKQKEDHALNRIFSHLLTSSVLHLTQCLAVCCIDACHVCLSPDAGY